MLRNLMMVSKECLNNIAKYSQASHCEVAALLTETQLLIRITDDGIGFKNEKRGSGNGLKNMKQRIQALGGHILIDSELGNGTKIGIVLPLQNVSNV